LNGLPERPANSFIDDKGRFKHDARRGLSGSRGLSWFANAANCRRTGAEKNCEFHAVCGGATRLNHLILPDMSGILTKHVGSELMVLENDTEGEIVLFESEQAKLQIERDENGLFELVVHAAGEEVTVYDLDTETVTGIATKLLSVGGKS
jgi:hypothetical protein